MDKGKTENNYTSTGLKLLKYLDRLKEFSDGKPVRPITLHIMPESKCNLDCCFCSVANRNTSHRLDLDLIKGTVSDLTGVGLKSVVISGGGEPCLYPHINEMMGFLTSCGLKVGLITNGSAFKRLTDESINSLSWVRISANVVDYIKKDQIYLPQFNGNTTVGLSYIVCRDMTDDSFTQVSELADKLGAKYVRISPNCLVDNKELDEAHCRVRGLIKDHGDDRFFHQVKKHQTPEMCYLGYFHPVLYCDGYIYPCDSLVLNDVDKNFDSSFRLCRAEDIMDKLYHGAAHNSLVKCSSMCTGCVWYGQNTFLKSILDDVEHEEFI